MNLITRSKPLFGKTIDIVLDMQTISCAREQAEKIIDEVYQEALERNYLSLGALISISNAYPLLSISSKSVVTVMIFASSKASM